MKNLIGNRVIVDGVFYGPNIEDGTFHGPNIEDGTFHGPNIEDGTFHGQCVDVDSTHRDKKTPRCPCASIEGRDERTSNDDQKKDVRKN